MLNFVIPLVALIFLVLSGMLILLICLLWKNLKLSQHQNRDLLNRLMSQDVQTFERLNRLEQSQSQVPNLTTTSSIVSMSDSDELKRYAQRHGLGETLFMEDPGSQQELMDMFSELGMEVPNDRD